MTSEKLRKLVEILLEHQSDNPELRLLARLRAAQVSAADMDEFLWIKGAEVVSSNIVATAAHLCRDYETRGHRPRHSLTPAQIRHIADMVARGHHAPDLIRTASQSKETKTANYTEATLPPA